MEVPSKTVILLAALGSLVGSSFGKGERTASLSPLMTRTYHAVGDHGRVFCATSSGVVVYDLGHPDRPRRVGSLALPQSCNFLLAAEGRLFLAQGPPGLYVLEPTRQGDPVVCGNFDTPGSAMMVAASGDILAVADGSMGVALLDASRPCSPRLLAYRKLDGYARGVAFHEGLLVVAAGSAGLYFLAPRKGLPIQAHCPSAGDARQSVASGKFLYVAEGARGVSTISLAGRRPRRVSTVAVRDFAHGIALGRGHLFVADGAAGVGIYALDDPSSPREVARIASREGYADRVSLAGKLLLVANDWKGLMVVDVSDPEHPRVLP